MCGIAGLFLPRGGGPRDANLGAMLSVMRHRGPDGTGIWTADDNRYQAGFRRLAIIDLETGDQPIVEKNGRRVLMGNGEIYNYLELRGKEENYPYRTQGDMEVVLPLHARHGDEFVHHLNGMFALALYEQDKHRLLLVRDRLGVKPLYWVKLPGGGILFASEIKALFASGLHASAVDEDGANAYLAHGFVPAPRTLFKGVNKLPPGHLLKVDADGGIFLERYWRPRPDQDLPQDTDGIAEYLTGLLRDSIRLQLRSDVPVGALLSGGIDSGLMVALAAEQSGQPINTFTVSFDGARMDEGPLADQIARRYATNHTALRLPAGNAGDHLARLAWFAEEPLNDAALLPNAMIEQVLGGSIKVALNGTGGDELFAGYGRYFQLPVERRYLALPRWLREKMIQPLTQKIDAMTAWQLERAALFETDRGAYLHEHSTHFPAPVRNLIGNSMALPAKAQALSYADFPGEAQSGALYADLMTYLPDDLLCLLDRTAMSESVEGRVPFLDHRLVEAALSVPYSKRTPENSQKWLERRMARAYLPEDVLSAPKQGFASPVPAWMRAGLGEQARRLLTRPAALDRGWWTADGIDRLLGNPERHGFRVYSLLMLELAVHLHVERPLQPSPPTAGLEEIADAA